MTEEKKSKEGSEKESKEGSFGSDKIVAVVDKAIEMDEKMQKRRLTLLNLALQDVKMMGICEEEGINPRDTFRGFVSDEGREKRLRIVTSGEEGEEKAKEMVGALGNSDEWRVKNESVPRVEWEDVEKGLNREKKPELNKGEDKRVIDEEAKELIRRAMEKNRREDEERERKRREVKENA